MLPLQEMFLGSDRGWYLLLPTRNCCWKCLHETLLAELETRAFNARLLAAQYVMDIATKKAELAIIEMQLAGVEAHLQQKRREGEKWHVCSSSPTHLGRS